MNLKKLAIVGVIALVVVGCVIAAGCTSNTTQQNASDDLKEVAGAWVGNCTYNGVEYLAIQQINPDSTGSWVIYNELYGFEVYPSTFSNFDGKGHFDKKSSDGITYKMTYSNGSLKESGGDLSNEIVYTRLDPILGIWFNEMPIDGVNTKFTRVFKNDGTGFLIALGDDGSVKVSEFTWKKNDDGTYTTESTFGTVTKVTMDKEKKSLAFVGDGISFTQERKFGDSILNRYMPNLGTWYNEESKYLTLFNADGTTVSFQDKKKVAEGTWKEKDVGTYVVTAKGVSTTGDDLSGKERIWTYNGKDNSLTSENGSVFVRPLKSVGTLVFDEITVNPIAGIWFCDVNDNKVEKAKATTLILDNGSTFCLASRDDGTSSIYTGSWKKNNDGTYTINWEDGDKEIITLNSAKDTLTTDFGSKLVKKSFNGLSKKVLGAWYSKDTDVLATFNGDGTGYMNGPKGLSVIKWEVTDAGKVAVTFVTGVKDDNGVDLTGKTQIWSYDDANGTLKNQSLGKIFTLPTEDIKDKFSFN